MLFNGKYYNKPGHLGMTRQQLKEALAGGGGGGKVYSNFEHIHAEGADPSEYIEGLKIADLTGPTDPKIDEFFNEIKANIEKGAVIFIDKYVVGDTTNTSIILVNTITEDEIIGNYFYGFSNIDQQNYGYTVLDMSNYGGSGYILFFGILYGTE